MRYSRLMTQSIAPGFQQFNFDINGRDEELGAEIEYVHELGLHETRP